MKKLLLVCLCIWISFFVMAEDIGLEIEYIGELFDDGGNGITGSVMLTFSLYTDPGAPVGQFVWQEIHQDVTVTGGTYSVSLGSKGSALRVYDFEQQLWIGVMYNEREIGQRYKLTVSSYALHAQQASDVAGQQIHPDAVYTGEIMTFNLSAIAIDTDSLTVKGRKVFDEGSMSVEGDLDVKGALTVTDDTGTMTGYPVPKGGIIMWSGGSDAVPDGWVLCNGAQGTPDLSGRFIAEPYGVGSEIADVTGDTGDAEPSESLDTSLFYVLAYIMKL